MRLEDQVCSLDLAKRLKELGVKQESLWYWHGDLKPEIKHTHNFSSIDNLTRSAFTGSELGEMLPIWHDSCKRENNDWHVRVFEKSKDNIVHNSFDATEANARARMLIYLLEQGLLNAADISKHT